MGGVGPGNVVLISTCPILQLADDVEQGYVPEVNSISSYAAGGLGLYAHDHQVVNIYLVRFFSHL